jgi:hypothetical protein
MPERLVIAVTFDPAVGYRTTGGGSELPVVSALSLGGIRRRVEALLLPDDVHIVLQLDVRARRERDRRRVGVGRSHDLARPRSCRHAVPRSRAPGGGAAVGRTDGRPAAGVVLTVVSHGQPLAKGGPQAGSVPPDGVRGAVFGHPVRSWLGAAPITPRAARRAAACALSAPDRGKGVPPSPAKRAYGRL